MKEIDNMKLDEVKYMIKKSKKLRTNLAGYSKMKEAELKDAVKRAINGEVVSKRKTVDSAWSKALKEFNKNRSSFLIPKKGSEEYNQVKALMGKTVSSVAKRSRVPKPKVLEDTVEEVGEDNPKMTRVKPKKA